METDVGMCPESDDTDLYGGLDESLYDKGNNSCTESMQECIDINSEGEILSDDPNTEETENVLDLIQDEMLLFDELLVAENRKRKENLEKERDHHNILIQTNSELKTENESLKQQVQELTSENVSLKQNISLLYKESKSEIECRDLLIADKNAKIAALEAELQQVLQQLFPQGRSIHNQSSQNDTKYCKSDASSNVRLSEKHSKSSSSSDERPFEKRFRSDTSSDCRSSETCSKSDASSHGKLSKPSEEVQEVNHTNERETRSSNKELCQKSVDSENTAVPVKIASSENKENTIASLHAVPRELAEALSKFETQQAVSLNSLRRAFSEYQERQGLMTNTLKGSVKNYFTEDPKPVTLVPLRKAKTSSTECNAEVATSKSSLNFVVDSKSQSIRVAEGKSEHHRSAEGKSEHRRAAQGKSEHRRAAESKSEHHRAADGKSEHHRFAEGKSEHRVAENNEHHPVSEGKSDCHDVAEGKSEHQQCMQGSPLMQKNPETESKKVKTVEPKRRSLQSYDGVPLKTLYQRRLAEKMLREKSEKEKEKTLSEEKPVESTTSKPSLVRRSRTPCRTYSPVKRRHHASRSDSYSSIRRIKRAKAFKPIVHRTPDKLPEVIKNDALDLFRFQGQPVPFAVKRKLGLKSKSSQRNKSPPEADKQQ